MCCDHNPRQLNSQFATEQTERPTGLHATFLAEGVDGSANKAVQRDVTGSTLLVFANFVVVIAKRTGLVRSSLSPWAWGAGDISILYESSYKRKIRHDKYNVDII